MLLGCLVVILRVSRISNLKSSSSTLRLMVGLTRSFQLGMVNLPLRPHGRGTIVLESSDPRVDPVVDHDYLTDPLDILVLAEGCAFANEILFTGSGTKDIVKNTWRKKQAHNKYITRDDWVPYVKEMATTCMISTISTS